MSIKNWRDVFKFTEDTPLNTPGGLHGTYLKLDPSSFTPENIEATKFPYTSTDNLLFYQITVDGEIIKNYSDINYIGSVYNNMELPSNFTPGLIVLMKRYGVNSFIMRSVQVHSS